jgi:hypothetical protein
VVRRQGLEPRLPGLRVQCFTRIARGAQRHHTERHAGVEPAFPAWRAGTLTARVNAATRFPKDSNLAPAELHSAALPDELENHRREARTRTLSTRPRTERANPYTTSRRVRGPLRARTGKPSPCGGVALPIGASSPRAARPWCGRGQPGQARRAHLARQNGPAFSLVFRCGVFNTQARSLRGVVLRMDGRNRTRNHWFWRPVLSQVELRPYVTQMKTARRVSPCERLLAGCYTSIQKPPRRPGQCAAASTRAWLYTSRLVRAGCLTRVAP